MAYSQLKGIYKVLLHHLSSYPFSRLDMPVPNDALSLASSRVIMSLRNDRTQDRLLALPGYLRILKATPYINLYNFLLDSYIAVAMIEDTIWQGGKLVAANVHNMLKRIITEIVSMTVVFVNKEAALLPTSGDQMMGIDASYGAEQRGQYRDMDPYEVLGIKSAGEMVVLSEWRDRFMVKAKSKFQETGLEA